MTFVKTVMLLVSMFISQFLLGQTKRSVESIEKVIISPHIETTFIQGDVVVKTGLSFRAPEIATIN